jgi:fructose-bisphosphate aldolase class 1
VRAYRGLIWAVQDHSESVSSAIPYDETILENKRDDIPFVKAIADTGNHLHIEVCTGAKDFRVIPERTTEGLRSRLKCGSLAPDRRPRAAGTRCFPNKRRSFW